MKVLSFVHIFTVSVHSSLTRTVKDWSKHVGRSALLKPMLNIFLPKDIKCVLDFVWLIERGGFNIRVVMICLFVSTTSDVVQPAQIKLEHVRTAARN